MKQISQALAVTVLLALGTFGMSGASAAGALRATGHQAQKGGQVIVFGRQGGNIRPFEVAIERDGTVKSVGPINSRGPVTLSSDAVHGLMKLVKAEKFFSLPHTISGGLFPDTASLYIRVTTSAGTTTVLEHATKNAQFDQLFAVLMASSGTTF